MININLDKELKYAIELAYTAGKRILEIYNKDFNINIKQDNSPVTQADIISDNIIRKGLKENFSYAILTEESKDNKSRLQSDYCWIVDPLDGTKEFINKNGEFTINIALVYKHRPILGIVYIPVQDILYYGVKNRGSYKIENNSTLKISVSNKDNKLKLLMSRSHASEKLHKFIEKYKNIIASVESAGSALKGCYIAEGKADIYIRYNPTKEWDTAAMQCIVENAGGVFKQLDGSEMFYNREDTINRKGFFIVNKEHEFIKKEFDYE